MKTLILAAIRCSLLFLVPSIIYGSSAQWDLDPISGDWNTADNRTPNGVPNGPGDTATFGLSNTTDVSISEDTEVNGIIFTSAATNPYGITVNAELTLTVSGVSITNNSGVNQTLTTVADASGNFGTIRFSNSATAAGVTISNEGGTTNFFDRSTAAGASIFNVGGGSTNFFNRSTAGSAFIENDFGSTNFFDNSSAGSAGFSSFLGGGIAFFDNSTAGNATINLLSFEGEAIVRFADSSNAGSATITLRFGTDIAAVSFEDSSQGGTARIRFDGFPGDRAILDISAHDAAGVTIGSIEGEGGDVFLGANNLTVGSNNLSTTFPGVIQDGSAFGGRHWRFTD